MPTNIASLLHINIQNVFGNCKGSVHPYNLAKYCDKL